MLDWDGETVVVPTIGVTSTVDGETVWITGSDAFISGDKTAVTPVTVVIEGDIVVVETVLAPLTVVVEGEITNVDTVVAPFTVVTLGVMENVDTVEVPVTEVVSAGTITEEGETGPTTMGFTTVPMAGDVTKEPTNIQSKRIEPTLALQP